VEEGSQPAHFDVYCPYMSLPLACGTSLHSVPNAVPYLYAQDDKVAAWAERLGTPPAGQTLRVGLVWSGAAIHTNDKNRSMALRELTPLLSLPHVSFVSMQKEYREADRQVLDELGGVIQDVSADLNDFSDTAALVQNMDVVISVDTSVAHLAGAMGKPVMLMLPYTPDFRWLDERNDSPWYPTMHLFRQASPTDWPSVVSSIQDVLSRISSQP
jgi:hypothetical protein